MKRKGKNKRPSKSGSSSYAGLHYAFLLYLVTTFAVVIAGLTVVGLWASDFAAMPWDQLVPFAVYGVGFPIILLGLRLFRWKGDPALLGTVMLLGGMGLVVQLRMGTFANGWETPLAFLPFPIALGMFLFGAILTGGGRGAWLRHLGIPAYLGALGVLGAMVVLGRHFRGGTFLAGNVNPTEIVKPLLVLFLAAWLSYRQEAFSEATSTGIPSPPLALLVILAVLWCLPIGETIILHDLGLAALLSAVLVIMLFAVSKRTGYLAIGLAAVAVAGFGVQFISANARTRFAIWLHPFSDPTGHSWQILQALAAMYSGGLWGAGLGAGVPYAVPIASSDFVYAAMAEEIGFVGCALLVLVYFLFISRGLRAAGAAATPFERLLCAGLTASLAVQALFNIAGVTKALPMTGITLPFISHGGSSLITSFFIAGLICGLSDPGTGRQTEMQEEGGEDVDN